jgi:hypothetical protein
VILRGQLEGEAEADAALALSQVLLTTRQLE